MSTLFAELENLGNIWRGSSARGDLRPEFDRSQVANGFVGSAVEPAATGEPYPSHGLGRDPAPVRRLDALPQNGYGEVTSHATVEARQMQSAGAGAGPVGLQPGQGAPASSPRAEEAGYGIPHGLRISSYELLSLPSDYSLLLIAQSYQLNSKTIICHLFNLLLLGCSQLLHLSKYQNSKIHQKFTNPPKLLSHKLFFWETRIHSYPTSDTRKCHAGVLLPPKFYQKCQEMAKMWEPKSPGHLFD